MILIKEFNTHSLVSVTNEVHEKRIEFLKFWSEEYVYDIDKRSMIQRELMGREKTLFEKF